ncbi:MAG: hypothetical protein PHV11_10105, partial [Candidatus Bipolaricaulis sp.]|nr:hypothetical protein [Candidatus Bipolaricaulis sp.]
MANRVLDKRISKEALCATIIGAGMALTPIHNHWLTDLVTESSGEVGFFLPAFGVALWIIAPLTYIAVTWG